MFNLLRILGWALAIVSFLGGILLWVLMFVDTSAGKKIAGVIAAVLGVVVFYYSYSWLESIGISMFLTGALLCMFGSEERQTSGKRSTSQTGGDLGDAVLDTLCEYELIKEATKSAIRESRQ